MKIIKIFLILVTATIFAVACGQSTPTPNGNTSASNTNKTAETPPQQKASPLDEATIARNLYTTHCMTCHKDSGKGGKTTVDGKEIDPDDITTAKQKAKSDEKIYGYISDGFPDDGMPAFKDKLKDDEIKLPVQHVRPLKNWSVGADSSARFANVPM